MTRDAQCHTRGVRPDGHAATYGSTITTTYDAGDRATDVVDSVAGTIERTYDLLDRLTEEVTPEGTISYAYDAAGRRTSLQVTGQSAVAYTYDKADRLTSLTKGTASVSLAYDTVDRRTSLTPPNGVVVEYTYDTASQLTGMTYKLGGTTLGNLAYTYDANGQRVSVDGTYARSSLPAALASATYDDANQIATWAGTSFTYDTNGNLTSDATNTYSWNAREQMSGITGGVAASFGYDGLGRRRSKTVTGTTTQFLYDGFTPVQELASGTPTANLLTGLGIDEYFTRTDSVGVRNHLTDALGSTVALADGSGTVQTEYTYEPFGGTIASGSSTTNALAFTAREADGTGLQFYRARYYDPRLQRFISEDPLGFEAGDVNVHAYVMNAPTMYVDPTGEFPWAPVVGCLIGAGGSAAADAMAGRKINWPSAAAGCAMGAFGSFGGGAGGAAAAAARGSGRREAAAAAARAAAREATRKAREAVRDLSDKIRRQMEQRGWTDSQIQDAIRRGQQYPATNRANGNPATRYQHPDTGQSVVVDNITGQVIHVGGPGFKY